MTTIHTLCGETAKLRAVRKARCVAASRIRRGFATVTRRRGWALSLRVQGTPRGGQGNQRAPDWIPQGGLGARSPTASPRALGRRRGPAASGGAKLAHEASGARSGPSFGKSGSRLTSESPRQRPDALLSSPWVISRAKHLDAKLALGIFCGFLELFKNIPFSANLRKTCVLFSSRDPNLRKSPQFSAKLARKTQKNNSKKTCAKFPTSPPSSSPSSSPSSLLRYLLPPWTRLEIPAGRVASMWEALPLEAGSQ